MLSGIVQGVGFRPFIYLHAQSLGLHGWVRNASGRVEVHVQGGQQRVEDFVGTLTANAPHLSRPVIESVETTDTIETDEFVILASLADADADIHLPADLFTCDDCLRELNDPEDRRYRYPFINCTQCGPRYTLIKSLPYDRVNTSMAGFPLCKACEAEYTDPGDRRYHAEPVACPVCGPELSFHGADGSRLTGNEAALAAAIKALTSGLVLAVKGIGGYHLVCDACEDAPVRRLRVSKPRPDKPLAIMFPAPLGDPLTVVGRYLRPTGTEAALLRSPSRPIVLVNQHPPAKSPDRPLSSLIAPGLNEIGAMLPYSPLHHTLLNDFGAPLVATSANLSGEPVLTENADVERRLAHVADAFLHHDRPIVRPADDPVIRVFASRATTIRQGRGLAPVEHDLPFAFDQPVLAVGTQMKNAVALGWDRRAVVSPHIGEMDNPRSLQTFEKCIDDLQALYQVEVRHIVSDAHPGYTATRWAHQHGLPVTEVFHHHAHASAAYLDGDDGDDRSTRRRDDMLVFTWDGVGYGPDGTLWGGEALLGRPGKWQRRASFRPFRLPGGERAGREPWRSAAAICWESGRSCPLEQAADPLLHSFWQQARNAPTTTAAGRLFDAASALLGICPVASFEGQGPMQLEALAACQTGVAGMDPVTLGYTESRGIIITDWEPLIDMLMDTRRGVAERAACFHVSLAHSLLQQARRVRRHSAVTAVGFAGGVFQNRVLTQLAMTLLQRHGFKTVLPVAAPVNDAGVSLGQLVEYAHN